MIITWKQSKFIRSGFVILMIAYLVPLRVNAKTNSDELLLNSTISPTIITLSDPTAGSVRAQLLALGYDPDQLTVSLVIAIGDGRMISLTDQQAEGNGNPAQWKGLTIVNPQARFTLRSGTLVLNDANVHLRGSFHYEGYWSGPDPSNRTRLLAGSRGLDGIAALNETFLNNQGGYLIFDGPTSAGADFVFSGDGVNSTMDGFVLRRLRLARSQGLSILDNGGASSGTEPSALVVSEKLEILSVLQPGDNHIKWIGGNERPNSGSIPEQRLVRIDTEELSGTGYFWLANQDQGADPNTITINGNDSGTRLRMNLRKSGSSGKTSALSDRLVGITHIGNDSVSVIEQGWLQSGKSLQEISGDLRLGADRASGLTGSGTFELLNGVSIIGALLLADTNSQALNASLANRASLILTTGSQDRKTIVKGSLHSAASASSGSGIIAGTSASTHAHDLVLEAAVRFGAEGATGAPGFNIARPSRLVLASAKDQVLDYLGGLGSVRIQRITIHSDAEYTLRPGTILQVNDLQLAKGSLTTNGGLAMVDLKAGEADYQAGSLDNFSMVSRSSPEAYLKKGIFASAYVEDEYKADGGSPFSLQYLGTTSITTGDEVPFPIIGRGNIAYLERFVVDLASNAQLNMNTNVIILSRLEMLSGTVDIPFNNRLHLKGNALWVQGEGRLNTINENKIIFPNNSSNVLYSSSNTSYDLFYVHKSNRVTGFEFNNGVRHLTVRSAGSKIAPVSLTLSGNRTVSGTVRIIDGELNLNNYTLTIGGNLVVDGLHNANNTLAFAANNLTNARVAGWFPNRKGNEAASLNTYSYGVGTTSAVGYVGDGYGRIVDTTGTLTFTGSGATASVYAVGYVQTGNRRFSLPNIILGNNRTLHFDLNQGFEGSELNEYRLLSYTQLGGNAHLLTGMIAGDPGIASDAPRSGAEAYEAGFTGKQVLQQWNVVGNFDFLAGNFWSWGATMTLGGNYTQGQDITPRMSAVFYGGQGRDRGRDRAKEDQATLVFQVLGDFTVLEDKAADVVPNVSSDNLGIHRFYLSHGNLKVGGNYSFFGHADVTDVDGLANNERGFRGTIEFNGSALQTVNHVQVTGTQPNAYKDATQYGRGFFNNVTLMGEGIVIGGGATRHIYLNRSGTLDLRRGHVQTGKSELVLFNENIEKWNVNTLTAIKPDQAPGIINSGSNSFVKGNLRRFMSKGIRDNWPQQTEEPWWGEVGYAFPLGHRVKDRDYYRPMTFTFHVNLGETISVLASATENEPAIINPTLNVAGLNGTLRLNKTSGASWNVSFDKRPALEPNIRLGAQGVITNPKADVDDMRIVARRNPHEHWRMLGVYNLSGGTNPGDSFNPNDWLDGIPTFWQEGVDFFAQNLTGPHTAEVRIATDCGWICFGGIVTKAYLQVIHNSPAGSVDMLVDNAIFLDNFAYQTATAFTPVAVETPLEFVFKTANGATELLTIKGAFLEADKSYILIIQGGADGRAFEVKVVDYARRTSTLPNAMQFFFSHGVTNGPAFNVQRVTTTTPRTLEQLIAVNATYGSAGNYLNHVDPGISTLQIVVGEISCNYLFDFGAYAGKSMTLLASGRVGGVGANRIMIMGVDSDGKIIVSQVTTPEDDSENFYTCKIPSSNLDDRLPLPTEFTVHGNYPNPFNPSTNLRFDLPEQANVRVEVVDLLGRMVMKVAPQTMSAGANKVITIDASSLSTGIYFYRIIAEGQTRTYIQTSKFTLVK